MNNWTLVLYLISAALLIWLMVRMVRGNPQAFSKENLSKSFYTVGIITILLIGVIFLCVLLLRST